MIRPRPAPVAPRLRLRLLATALGLGFLVVGGQLANLQILSGERLAALSDRNRLRLRPIAAPRGILFDRTGLPLVDNRPAFTLVVVPRDVPDLGALVERLAQLLAVPESELRDRLARVSPPDSPWPIRLARGLTLEEVARIEEWRLDLPGVTVEVEPQRAYPGVRFAAHLLGYVREASDQDLGRNGTAPRRPRRADRARAAPRRAPPRPRRRRAGRGRRLRPADPGPRPAGAGARRPHVDDDRPADPAGRRGRARRARGRDRRHGSAQRRRARPGLPPGVPRRAVLAPARPRDVARAGPGPGAAAPEPRGAGDLPARLAVQDHRRRRGSPGAGHHAVRPPVVPAAVDVRRPPVSQLGGPRPGRAHASTRRSSSPATRSSTSSA